VEAPGTREVIVVIDDDALVGKSVKRMLERRFDVRLFSAAREALEWLASAERCDAILCDVMMPVMGGAEFHAALKERRPELADRVIFATGGAFTGPSQALLASARYSLEKPFAASRLLEVLHEMLAARREGGTPLSG
jgi:CheY-like chemotaxis protein